MKHNREEKQQAISHECMLTLVLETRVSHGKNRDDPFPLSFAYSHITLWHAAISQLDRKKVADAMGGALCYLVGSDTCSLIYLGRLTPS